MSERIPIIALVGRPNVGKSTLFNALVGNERAVVDDQPGVTRDRNYAFTDRFSIPFYVVDTGGLEKDPVDELHKFVVEQTMVAIEEADVVIAIFDANVGLQPGDEDVVGILRKTDKPVYYFANKCDSVELLARAADFYALGVDEILDVSALGGRNIKQSIEKVLTELPDYKELFDASEKRLADEAHAEESARSELPEEELTAFLESQEVEAAIDSDGGQEEVFEATDFEFPPVFVPGETQQSQDEYIREYRLLEKRRGDFSNEDDDEVSPDESFTEELAKPIKIAIIGRPNVGKSTLLNSLVGEKRAITSDIAGTTRDKIEARLERDGQNFVVIDTAGLRKQGKVSEGLEKYSVLRSLRAIAECDVAVVVLDATSGPVEQDEKIVGLAHEEGKGIVIAINKWDAVEKDHKTAKEFEQNIRDVFNFTPYAPLLFISALSGKRTGKVLEAVRDVAISRTRRVKANRLNRVLQRAVKKHTPPVYRGNPIKLYYGVQVATCPPKMALFFNYPKEVHFSYLRYLKNELRDSFGFEGTDIKFFLRKR